MRRLLRSHPPTTRSTIARHIDAVSAGPEGGMRRRLETVLATLGDSTSGDTADLLVGLARALSGGEADRMWLALAVLSAQLPDESEVKRACRAAELDGPLAALADILTDRQHAGSNGTGPFHRRVEVVTGGVVVDLHHTSGAVFATGVQRVAREAALHWQRTHDIVLVGWTPGYTALHRLPPSILDRTASQPGNRGSHAPLGDLIVPWRSTYVLPEILGEAGRVDRFHALARYSGNHSASIGFDCVPLTTGETAIVGMGGDFANYLSAVAQIDRVATISPAAALEYRGWRTMLTGAGIDGPEIVPIPLPIDRPALDEEAVAFAREQLAVPGLPMALVVGSHEPRKNHLAVLHAAELLWREGLEFSLLLVGGNSWNSQRFTTVLHNLQSLGRPVHALRALSDELLWAAYATARCTVFPSLNEGFGLPVAESIASGTPVITSNFGSMREIAEAGGALLVDPRDDHDIARALRRLLTDDALQADLAQRARERPHRTWEHYGDETWRYLVEGIGPDPR